MQQKSGSDNVLRYLIQSNNHSRTQNKQNYISLHDYLLSSNL
jgi:hypothetical protein